MIEYQHVDKDNEWNGLYVCTTWGRKPDARYERMIRRLLVWAAETDVRFTYRDHNGKSGVADGHNHLIDTFLETDLEWMLHLDADCIITPAHIERLASWKAPVVAALALRRKPPYTPAIYRTPWNDKWVQDFDWIRDWLMKHLDQLNGIDHAPLILRPKEWPLHKVRRVGAHCLLVHRSVIEAIEPPWYVAPHKSGSGSDFAFCEKVEEAGFDIMVDLSVIAGHLQGDYCTGPLDWLVWDRITDYDGAEERLEIHIEYEEEADA